MHARRFTTATTAALLLFALVACSDDDDADGDPDSGTATSGTATSGTAAIGCVDGTPELTVTDAGAKPRNVMRYSPSAGDTTTVEMEMSTVTDISVDGQSAPTQSGPPVVLGLVITVDDVTDNQIDMSFIYDKAETEDSRLQDSLDSLNGLSGTLSTDRSGAFIDGRIAADGADADADVRSLIEQSEQQLADITVPLPAEPIGSAATWDVASSFESGGVTYCNHTTYTLAGLDGDKYQLDVESTQQVQPTTIDENGVSIDVRSGSGSSTGRSDGSLRTPIATSSSSQTTSRTEMNVKQDGSEQKQEIDVTLDFELRQRG